MLKAFVIFLISLGFSPLCAWSQDTAPRQEIERLKQRIEALEKKLEKEDDDTSGLTDMAGMVSIGGVIAGAYQHEWVSGGPDAEDRGRGALAIQPEIGIAPTENDLFFFKLGFAARNGLPGVTAFALSPWAADLEEDVKNINGGSRDFLLTAWYRHVFTFGEEHTLGLTGGLIDATDYLDDNAYANDEYTQFMNAALVNGPNTFLPSYDVGAAAEWDSAPIGAKVVYMNVNENDDGNNYNFYGAQLNYTLKTKLGQGHYRVGYHLTSKAFLDPGETSKERQKVISLSFDQALGDIFGAWLRLAFGSEDALIEYKSLYSGGVDISGRWWGREQDNIGIGYAYLDGAEQTTESLKTSQVAEGYMRFGLNDYLALTLDLQYLKDDVKTGEDVDGWIAGLRMTAEF